MYAVIETGGKQYRVELGTELQVELLDVQPGQAITLDRVLLVADGETATVGRPVVAGASVSAEVLRQDRGVKTISFKYRPKARRRVKKGHRQDLTVLRVTDLLVDGRSAAEAARSAEAEAKTERQRLEEAAARQAAEDAALAAKLAARSATATTPDEGKAGDAAPKRGRGRAKAAAESTEEETTAAEPEIPATETGAEEAKPSTRRSRSPKKDA